MEKEEETMDNEEKQKPKEESKDDNAKGDKPTANDKIDRANAAAQRMEEATEKMAKETDRREDLMATAAIGGESEAGQEAPEKKEETPQEYKDKVMSGDLNE